MTPPSRLGIPQDEKRVGVMSKHDHSFEPSGELDGDVESSKVHAFGAAVREPHDGMAAASDSLRPDDQLARDIAEIERASKALRKAEPALEPWIERSAEDPLAVTPPGPPPVWLLIGAWWLVMALVAVGAIASIAHWIPAHAGASRSYASISVSVGGGRKHRAGDDLQVKPERPIVDIK